DGVFAASDKAGRLRGGFKIAGLAWSGRMEGKERAPAQLKTGAIDGRLSSANGQTILDVTAAAPDFAADFPAQRHLRARAQNVTARVLMGSSWSVGGVIANAAVDDTSLPGHLADFTTNWRGEPRRDGQAVFRLENGHGRLFDPADKALFHPINATG